MVCNNDMGSPLQSIQYIITWPNNVHKWEKHHMVQPYLHPPSPLAKLHGEEAASLASKCSSVDVLHSAYRILIQDRKVRTLSHSTGWHLCAWRVHPAGRPRETALWGQLWAPAQIKEPFVKSWVKWGRKCDRHTQLTCTYCKVKPDLETKRCRTGSETAC